MFNDCVGNIATNTTERDNAINNAISKKWTVVI